MKKYTKKHLESVPPEFILAAEKAVDGIEADMVGKFTCPSLILKRLSLRSKIYFCEKGGGSLCETYLKYHGGDRDSPCPCYRYGENKAIELFNNLITQWKAWAGVED
jgi:hypothetical protein